MACRASSRWSETPSVKDVVKVILHARVRLRMLHDGMASEMKQPVESNRSATTKTGAENIARGAARDWTEPIGKSRAWLDLCLTWDFRGMKISRSPSGLPMCSRITRRSTLQCGQPVRQGCRNRDSVEASWKSQVLDSSPTLASGPGCGRLLESQQKFSRENGIC